MRILYVGELWEGGTALQRARALEELGHTLTLVDSTQPATGLKGVFRRVVRKFLGHSIDVTGTNHRATEAAMKGDFEIVWIGKALSIKPGTLRHVKVCNVGARLVSYSPDDMMGKHNQSPRYLAGVPIYDVLVTTKSYNVRELKSLGARRVIFVENAYDPKTHSPLELSAEDAALHGAEISFVGAHEEDRARHLLQLARAGLRVTVWGPGWKHFHESHPNLLVKRKSANGLEYTKVLNAAKINLCFLRKLNRDLQTTRSVEIPACGAFMLAERTQEHQRLFTEGIEAEYFEGIEELEQKCRQYLADETTRNAIARRARERCLDDGYSNSDRLRKVLAEIARDGSGRDGTEVVA
jgi:hypothetical protein